MFALTTREVGDVTIVDITGEILLMEGSQRLRDKIKELLARGQRKILLNLKGATSADSSGIGELVSSFTTVANAGGSLKLLNLSGNKIEGSLHRTNLYRTFEVFYDEANALKSFV